MRLIYLDIRQINTHNDFVTFYTDGAYLLKANETLDREIMDTSYMHYK